MMNTIRMITIFKNSFNNNRFFHYTPTPELKCPQCYYVYSKERWKVLCYANKAHKQSQKKPPSPKIDRFQLKLRKKVDVYIAEKVKKPVEFVPRPYGSTY